jgi:hypothetical protein
MARRLRSCERSYQYPSFVQHLICISRGWTSYFAFFLRIPRARNDQRRGTRTKRIAPERACTSTTIVGWCAITVSRHDRLVRLVSLGQATLRTHSQRPPQRRLVGRDRAQLKSTRCVTVKILRHRGSSACRTESYASMFGSGFSPRPWADPSGILNTFRYCDG